MTTQASTKVRLVRCPICRQVLPEFPGVPLYECGGCGTVLQAKNRKMESIHPELSSQETDTVANSQQDNVLEEKEVRTSDHDLGSPPKMESSPDKDILRFHDEHGDCSTELSSCPELTCPQDLPAQVEESWVHKNPLSQSSERYYSTFHDDDNGEWTRGRSFSNEFPSSGELTHEAEEYYNTSEASEHVEQHNESDLHREVENFVDEVQNLPEQENQVRVPKENDENKNEDCHGGIKHGELSTSSGIVSHDNANIQSGEQINEMDDGGEALPIARSSSTKKNTLASVGDSTVASLSRLNESFVSLYLTCPDDEHLGREGVRNFERVSSVDTSGSSSATKLSSELNLKHPSMSRYPTSSYYAYDGSESSYDGADDQICERIPHSSRKSSDVHTVVNNETEMNYRAMSSSHQAIKSNNWSQEKPTETSRYRQGGVSRLPLTSRNPLAGHRTVSPSGYHHYLLPPRPGFKSSDKPSYSELEKMNLLRTMGELKDQLSRMHFPQVIHNRRFTEGVMDGEFATFPYDHLAPEREIYAERSNISRMAFSGESARCRHQVSFSCSHCHPQEWHYSAHLPSHTMHRKSGCHAAQSEHNCCGVSSSSSSPQHYTRRDEIKRVHLKEKYHTAKRHLRPMAGGAPLVACYHCSALLQLPVDFLLFKKRYHQLMCNACRKVLKFSVTKGTHIVPYAPNPKASAPPPSEADDCNDAITGRRNLDHPVSCSDDYGLSFCRSCSTEGEASIILPHNRKMSSGGSREPVEDRKMKSVLVEPAEIKNYRSLLKTVESVGSSSTMPKLKKPTSEIEEVPTSSNSPLHQLMGYSSPSQVLR